jgi:hypothetical protein
MKAKGAACRSYKSRPWRAYSKNLPPQKRGKILQTNLLRLRRGRRRHIDVCVRLGLGLSRRRWVHNRGVSFFLFRLLPSSRRSDGGFLLFAGREQRGACQDADVFFHSVKIYKVTE